MLSSLFIVAGRQSKLSSFATGRLTWPVAVSTASSKAVATLIRLPLSMVPGALPELSGLAALAVLECEVLLTALVDVRGGAEALVVVFVLPQPTRIADARSTPNAGRRELEMVMAAHDMRPRDFCLPRPSAQYGICARPMNEPLLPLSVSIIV